MACINSVAPLQLPITSVPATINGIGLTQGIAVSIGDPHQLFSLRPTVADNDTWVYNIQSCANTSDYACIARLGGLYDPQSSHTGQVTNNLNSWNGTIDSELQPSGSYVFFNDIFSAGGNGPIIGYPFVAYTRQHTDLNSKRRLLCSRWGHLDTD
jgi:hypothetical protein